MPCLALCLALPGWLSCSPLPPRDLPGPEGVKEILAHTRRLMGLPASTAQIRLAPRLLAEQP